MLRIEAYERVKRRLLSGDLKPGQFVSQRELADLVGVSLGPAREAVLRLEFESLIRVYPQRGIQIAEASVRVIRTAYEFRLLIERAAVAHFARHASETRIAELADEARQILARAANGADAALLKDSVEVDWRMHDAVVDSMDNEITSEAYRVNAARIRLARSSNQFDPERLVAVMTEHLAVLDASIRRDMDGAVAALETHVLASRDRALAGR
jgi:DNA-binding GntR family transcriptional regulator